VFARSSKFSLFDPAKEMVYIEMSKDEKSKGKAAVDLVGSQIGKSGASWLTQARLLSALVSSVRPPNSLRLSSSLVSFVSSKRFCAISRCTSGHVMQFNSLHALLA